jgi:hypothetical protein
VLIAIFAPYIAPATIRRKAASIRRLKPIGTPGYILGTDELGRDMLSRLIYGARLSLFMGVIPVPVAFVIGSAIGIIAGYAGGMGQHADHAHDRRFLRFPSVLLAVALSGALGSGLTNALVSLTVVFIPQIARIAESVTTQARKLDYVEAGRASGGTRSHHHPGPHSRQCAQPDLRLRDEPDLGLDDPGLRPVVPRPWRASARRRMGADAEHTAHRDLQQSVRGGAAGIDDLHHLDLLQPFLRRAAHSHGREIMSVGHSPYNQEPAIGERGGAGAAADFGSRSSQAFPVKAADFSDRRKSCAPSMASISPSSRARRWASSAKAAAASRPRRGC